MNYSYSKYYGLITTIIFFLFQVFVYGKSKDSDNIKCENYISIRGSSNINQFKFVNYNPIIHRPEEPDKKLNGYNNVQVPVYDFTGPNNRMLNDFYKMVNASEYPYIQIEIEPRRMADFDEGTGLTNFKTEISIAGKTKDYIVPCEITSCENSPVVLKGNFEVELSDFNISPPVKMFGTIKVNNEVFINFVFKFIPENKKPKTVIP